MTLQRLHIGGNLCSNGERAKGRNVVLVAPPLASHAEQKPMRGAPKPTELRARPRPVTDRAAPGNADAPGVARAADVSVIPMVEAETSGIGLAART